MTKVGEVTGAAHAEALAEAAGQRGLARAELAGEQHQVAGAQQRGEPPAQLAHALGGRGR